MVPRASADTESVRPLALTKVLALPLSLVALAAPGAAWADDGAGEASTLIVQRVPGLSPDQREEVREDADVDFVRSLPLPDTELVEAPEGDTDAALRALQEDPSVAHAEVDQPIFALGTTDALWGNLWALENVGQFKGTAGADLDIQAAWAVTRGAGQTVAVVDTGVTATHQDLLGQIDSDDAYDYVDRDTNPQDSEGHGTHVTGTIAALANNKLGIAGVAPEAQILPLRVMSSSDGGRLSDVIQAFDRAGRLGIRVVNASFGASSTSRALQDVIAAYPRTLFVAAAGNDGVNVDAKPIYPCAVPLANVVCVGASDMNDAPATFAKGATNVGAQTVDLFAPGTKILSTWKSTTSYATAEGTSMAAPHVAGTLALIFAQNPALTATQAKAKLLAGVDRVAQLAGRAVTGGRVNAAGALRAPTPPPDADEDGVADAQDLCPATPDPAQGDSDGDGVGDACDPTPNPPTVTVAAPPPAPKAPAVAQLKGLSRSGTTIRACRRGERRCKPLQVTLSFTVTAPARLKLVLERQACTAPKVKRKGTRKVTRKPQCRYAPAASRDVVALAGKTSLVIGPTVGRTKLAAGTYRAVLQLGAQRASVPFSVK